jgi:hypothetical protein
MQSDSSWPQRHSHPDPIIIRWNPSLQLVSLHRLGCLYRSAPSSNFNNLRSSRPPGRGRWRLTPIASLVPGVRSRCNFTHPNSICIYLPRCMAEMGQPSLDLDMDRYQSQCRHRYGFYNDPSRCHTEPHLVYYPVCIPAGHSTKPSSR